MTYTRRRALPASGDEGFTILEIVVAVGVIFVAMVAMAHAATIALIDVGHARQRQSATGLANRAIEQVRALPAATVQRGLSAADLAQMTDPNVTKRTVGGVTRYIYKGEELLTHTPVDTSPLPPLVPHRVQTKVGPTTYWVSVYATLADDGETVRVTAEASWADQALRRGTSGEVEAQTLMSPGVGCAGSLEVNPYAAPCAADLQADAFIDEPRITIRPTTPPTASGQFESATLTLPLASSTLSVGQVNLVRSTVTTSGASMKIHSQDPSIVGGQLQEALSTPDTDEYVTATTASQGRLMLSSSGIRVTTAAADSTNAAVSAVVARTTQPCYDVLGITLQDDHLPCGSAASRQLDTATAELVLPDGSAIPLVTIAQAPESGTKARVDRTVLTGSCPLEGCVDARVTRSLGDVLLGGHPTTAAWLVEVDDLVDHAQAAAGESVNGPEATMTGSVRELGASSGIDLGSLSGTTATATLSPRHDYEYSPVNVTDVYTVTMSGSFVVSGANTIDPACDGLTACPDPRERGQAEAASGSALHGSYRIVVTASVTTSDGTSTTTVADLIVEVNLGRAVARATFERAPSAAF